METFEQIALSPETARAIDEMGLKRPTEVQAQTIPLLLEAETDFIGLAATGTGKTAAFSLPLLEKINPHKKSVQALILCPTRELALQVCGQINLMGKYKKIKSVAVYGGASYGDQIYGLKSGAQVVVGTPGRVLDHLRRGTLNLDHLQKLVLDEADEMISMGFREDLEVVLESLDREQVRVWLFSATMAGPVRQVADQYLEDPIQVQTNKQAMLSQTVEQIYFPVKEADKPEILCKIIESAEDFYGVIFCQTKNAVADLTRYLNGRNFKADCLHGDRSQKERETTMRAFRARQLNVLVCTDVAARGIDVAGITHVINYSLPRELDSYVHRIGRTARSGKAGQAMCLVTPSQRGLVRRIEQLTKSRMVEGKIPTRREIGAKKVAKFLELFLEQKDFERAIQVMDPQWLVKLEQMSPQEVAGRFLNLQFPDVFKSLEPRVKAPPLPLDQAKERLRVADNKKDRRLARRALHRSKVQGRNSNLSSGEGR